VARLLGVAAEETDRTEQARVHRTAAEVLADMLNNAFPLAAAEGGPLRDPGQRRREGRRTTCVKAIGDLLMEPNSDLAAIKALKDHTKALVSSSEDDAEHAGATAIYYAAIAHALLFHGRKITGHSYGKLQEAFEKLAGKPWVPSEVKTLYRKASAVCHSHRSGGAPQRTD